MNTWNDWLCFMYSIQIKYRQCVSLVSNSCSLFPAGSIFLTDLTLSLQSSVPARSLQSRAKMNEVEWKTLTLTYEAQQLETKEVPQQSRGLKGLVAAGRGSATTGKEPPQCVHSHANTTATGIQKLWLSQYTDKLVLSTLGCNHSDQLWHITMKMCFLGYCRVM